MEINPAEQAAVTAVTPPAERAALALNSTQTERDLRELAVKYAGIQVIKDKAGRDQAHGAYMEIKRSRTTVERVGKEARDDATKFSKAVIAEQNRLVAIIVAEESRLLALRDAWDAEQARIKEEEAAAERARIEQIRQRIEDIAHFERMALNCRTSAAVERLQGVLSCVELRGMQEFEDEALRLHDRITQRLVEIRAERQADEAERACVKAEQAAEAARLAAERAELERQREAARAAAQRETERLAAEQERIRAAEAAAQEVAAERERKLQAQAQAERERLAAEAAALAAARAEFEQRQRAHDERERAEREAIEAAAKADAPSAAQIELERQRKAARLAAERLAAEDAALAAAKNSKAPATAAELETRTPSAAQLIQAVAEMFGASLIEARNWLVQRAEEIEEATV